jgi:hypothetical protein
MHKFVSQDTLYKSFKAYEAQVEKDVRSGSITNSTARSLVASARKNYQRQNLNREIEKINAGNTKESSLYV